MAEAVTYTPDSQQETAMLRNNSAGDGLDTMSVSERHIGYVKKLLSTYGFIQYGEKNVQLFFHYSEFNGVIDELDIGDQVEFQISQDAKGGSQGRPLAVTVVKVISELDHSGSGALPEKEFRGTVMMAPKASLSKESTKDKDEVCGRLSYEQNGECFYLPFFSADLQGTVKDGDIVTFSISNSVGDARATEVKKVIFQGVICSLKENFGFIERADEVREIFFHYSEFNGGIEEIILGDDVEYEIQIRNGKEVAVGVTCLPAGTVVFDDIQVDLRRGKVKKAPRGGPKKGSRGSPAGPGGAQDPLPGLIVYNTIQCEVEIPFGERDVSGDYTLFQGDVVHFQIATDRRDGLQRAVNVAVQNASFNLSKEVRKQGVVCSLKETYGFIKKAASEGNIFFHFSELIKSESTLNVGDEVEFTSATDNTARSARQVALRILRLPKGTFSMETSFPPLSRDNAQREITGVVVIGSPKRHSTGPPPHGNASNGTNKLLIEYYDNDGKKRMLPFNNYGDLRQHDKVSFKVSDSPTDGRGAMAISVRLREVSDERSGYVAVLKDSYGFIESADLQQEIFFHFSCCEGKPDLELGDCVMYVVVSRGKKISAENVRKVSNHGYLQVVSKDQLHGRVTRSLKIWNNGDGSQAEYWGLLQVDRPAEKGESSDEKLTSTYKFGIFSLTHKDHMVSVGELVQFEPRKAPAEGDALYAVNLSPSPNYLNGRVDSLKGPYGFIEYEGGQTVYFHGSDVKSSDSGMTDGSNPHGGLNGLEVDDKVMFLLMRSQRSNKLAAVDVQKLQQARPERLIHRLKQTAGPTGPRLCVIREPRRPDGTKGFTLVRQ